jgi:phosphatidylinositol kinase/protein kinase (PI-3  family)
MVGYILGLGDRHPSNLMLDKLSGRVLHIDFGDCFEGKFAAFLSSTGQMFFLSSNSHAVIHSIPIVAMNRDKFPERVPFRLTRMLIRAMEVAGIEGSYRSTCERTMTVLRDSRDSLVAMLEAFVYDPLISWRLADLSPGTSMGAVGGQTNNPSQALGTAGIAALGGAMDRGRGLSSALSGVPIWEHPGDEEDDGDADLAHQQHPLGYQPGDVPVGGPRSTQLSSRARSLQMYQNIQAMAANLSTDSRVLSIAAGDRSDAAADLVMEGSMARSRIERTSMRQRELMSLLEDKGAAHEEALNEKALKVIRRVQDKLTGTDFPDSSHGGGTGGGGGGDRNNSDSGSGGGDPLDVPDQVQRLIIQATSSENLCQLFIGWCAFW